MKRSFGFFFEIVLRRSNIYTTVFRVDGCSVGGGAGLYGNIRAGKGYRKMDDC